MGPFAWKWAGPWDGSSGPWWLGVVGRGDPSCRWASGRCSALRGKRACWPRSRARIAADPVAIPDPPDPEGRPLPARDRDRSFRRGACRVLVSPARPWGRATASSRPSRGDDGRRILVDRGVIRVADGGCPKPPPGGALTVTGNLHWPEEQDGFTPRTTSPTTPGSRARCRFPGRPFRHRACARDRARPLEPGGGDAPCRSPSEGHPERSPELRDHMVFRSLAVWLGMTLFLLWRIRRRTV